MCQEFVILPSRLETARYALSPDVLRPLGEPSSGDGEHYFGVEQATSFWKRGSLPATAGKLQC